MITYRFISQVFLGQPIKVQYSKYSSAIRIDLGSGTFPFEYTTDQKGGTYYFYIPSVDRTFTKTIEVPPIDIFIDTINVPDCDISGMIESVPSCDVGAGIIEVPVCDIDYGFALVSPTPTPTNSIACPSILGVTVGPIEISGGQEYTLADNPTSTYFYQFNTSNEFIANIPPFTNSILPDSLFADEIMVLVPAPYWIGGPCQYCFNINLGIEVPCVTVTPTSTPTHTVTPTITPTKTITPTPSITENITPTVTPTNTITPTPSSTEIVTPTVTPTPTITPTPSSTESITPTVTPTNTNTPTVTQTLTNTPTNTNTPNVTQTQSEKAFISVWSGSSVTLPYNGIGTYTGTIYWGDGSVSANTFANRTHAYSGNGPWTITITGTITGWATSNAPTQSNKLLEIKQWNNVRNVFGQAASFSGCSNLVLTGVTDTYDFNGITNTQLMFTNCTSITTINNISSWNVSGVTNIGSMFNGCINFNDNISTWNVSNVTSMTNMLYNANSFNQDLSSWYIINVLSMNNMLDNTAISTLNYDNLLIGWNDLAINIGLEPNVNFGVLGLKYTSAGAGARSAIITNQGWTFVGDTGI